MAMREWKVSMKLKGAWTDQAVQDLNTAIEGWWSTWCDDADFFTPFSVQRRGKVTIEYFSSDSDFADLVEFAINGDNENCIAAGFPLFEKREDFDKTVHQRLLESMKAQEAMIAIALEEKYPEDPDEDIVYDFFRIISNGSQFELVSTSVTEDWENDEDWNRKEWDESEDWNSDLKGWGKDWDTLDTDTW